MNLLDQYKIKIINTPISGYTGDINSRKIDAILMNYKGVRVVDTEIYFILTANLPNGGFAEWTQRADSSGVYSIILDNSIFTVAGTTELSITARKNEQTKTSLVLSIPVQDSKLISLSTSKPIEKPLKDADTVDGRHASDFIIKGTGIKQTDLSPELLQQMAGNTPINAVPADGSLITSKYADLSVTLQKTNFGTQGKNLFNKALVKLNTYIASTGAEYSTANVAAGPYIPVTSGLKYAFQKTRQISWYTSDKVFISNQALNDINTVVTAPTNAAYVRMSFLNGSVPFAQMELGEDVTQFEDYKWYIKSNFLERQQIDNKDILPNAISPTQTTFAITTRNLFDKSKAIIGKYVNQVYGTIVDNAIHYVSDYIEVPPNSNIAFKVITELRVAFYDINKNYISGQYNPTIPIKSPPLTKYLRFSSTNIANIDLQQVELGNTSTPYVKFGVAIPNLILDSEMRKGNTEELILPPKIHALVGQELNIYFDNIFNFRDRDFDFDVSCSIGGNFTDYYRVTPTTAGSYPITIQAIKDGVTVASVSSTIVVTAATAGNGVNKKVLVLGDSTTDSGYSTARLLENFDSDVMDITLLGTRQDVIQNVAKSGTYTVKHEGRSGWTIAKYFTGDLDADGVANPFFNPATSTFDFTYYVQGKEVPDYLIINLGINDTFNYTDDNNLNTAITEIFTKFDTVISQVKAFNSNIKIGVAITIPPNYSQNAFGKAYANNQTRVRYKRNNFIFVKALIEKYKNRETDSIYLVPININLDTKNNMGFEQQKVNARNPKMIDSPIGNGGVHPAPEGYHQIADVYWYWIKSFEV